MCVRSLSDTSSFTAVARHDALVPLEPLATFNAASQVNACCLVLFDTSDRMSKALAGKGKLVLGICLKHGQAHDVARNDVRDFILIWTQAGRVLTCHRLHQRYFPLRVGPEVVTELLSHSSECHCEHFSSSSPRGSLCFGSRRAATTCSS